MQFEWLQSYHAMQEHVRGQLRAAAAARAAFAAGQADVRWHGAWPEVTPTDAFGAEGVADEAALAFDASTENTGGSGSPAASSPREVAANGAAAIGRGDCSSAAEPAGEAVPDTLSPLAQSGASATGQAGATGAAVGEHEGQPDRTADVLEPAGAAHGLPTAEELPTPVEAGSMEDGPEPAAAPDDFSTAKELSAPAEAVPIEDEAEAASAPEGFATEEELPAPADTVPAEELPAPADAVPAEDSSTHVTLDGPSPLPVPANLTPWDYDASAAMPEVVPSAEDASTAEELHTACDMATAEDRAAAAVPGGPAPLPIPAELTAKECAAPTAAPEGLPSAEELPPMADLPTAEGLRATDNLPTAEELPTAGAPASEEAAGGSEGGSPSVDAPESRAQGVKDVVFKLGGHIKQEVPTIRRITEAIPLAPSVARARSAALEQARRRQEGGDSGSIRSFSRSSSRDVAADGLPCADGLPPANGAAPPGSAGSSGAIPQQLASGELAGLPAAATVSAALDGMPVAAGLPTAATVGDVRDAAVTPRASPVSAGRRPAAMVGAALDDMPTASDMVAGDLLAARGNAEQGSIADCGAEVAAASFEAISGSLLHASAGLPSVDPPRSKENGAAAADAQPAPAPAPSPLPAATASASVAGNSVEDSLPTLADVAPAPDGGLSTHADVANPANAPLSGWATQQADADPLALLDDPLTAPEGGSGRLRGAGSSAVSTSSTGTSPAEAARLRGALSGSEDGSQGSVIVGVASGSGRSLECAWGPPAGGAAGKPTDEAVLEFLKQRERLLHGVRTLHCLTAARPASGSPLLLWSP